MPYLRRILQDHRQGCGRSAGGPTRWPRVGCGDAGTTPVPAALRGRPFTSRGPPHSASPAGCWRGRRFQQALHRGVYVCADLDAGPGDVAAAPRSWWLPADADRHGGTALGLHGAEACWSARHGPFSWSPRMAAGSAASRVLRVHPASRPSTASASTACRLDRRRSTLRPKQRARARPWSTLVISGRAGCCHRGRPTMAQELEAYVGAPRPAGRQASTTGARARHGSGSSHHGRAYVRLMLDLRAVCRTPASATCRASATGRGVPGQSGPTSRQCAGWWWNTTGRTALRGRRRQRAAATSSALVTARTPRGDGSSRLAGHGDAGHAMRDHGRRSSAGSYAASREQGYAEAENRRFDDTGTAGSRRVERRSTARFAPSEHQDDGSCGARMCAQRTSPLVAHVGCT